MAFAAALAAIVGALALLGVRDVRCYAAVLAWGPTSNALEMTNLSAFLVLALALGWRYRASLWPLATILGLAVSTKLFVWPVLVWAVATRRYRAAVRAVGLGVAVTLCSWAVIGFADLTRYPELLRRFSELQGAENSYSILAVASVFGLGTAIGHVVAVFVGIALLVMSGTTAGGSATTSAASSRRSERHSRSRPSSGSTTSSFWRYRWRSPDLASRRCGCCR